MLDGALDDDLYLDYDDITRNAGEPTAALLRELVSRVSWPSSTTTRWSRTPASACGHRRRM